MSVSFNCYGAAKIRVMFRFRNEWPWAGSDALQPKFHDLGFSISGVDVDFNPRRGTIMSSGCGGREGFPAEFYQLDTPAFIRIKLAKFDPKILVSIRNLMPGIGPGNGNPGKLLYSHWLKTMVADFDGAGDTPLVAREVKGYVRLLIVGKQIGGIPAIMNFPTAIPWMLQEFRGSEAAFPAISFYASRRPFGGMNDKGESSDNLAVLMNESEHPTDSSEPII